MNSLRNTLHPPLGVLLGLILAASVTFAHPVHSFWDSRAARDMESSSDKKEKNRPQVRDLSGEVMDSSEAPLPNAIVYLKSRSTQSIKSMVTGKDGSYHFPGLSPDADYELYAEREGEKSETRTLSSLDGRAKVTLNLTITRAKN